MFILSNLYKKRQAIYDGKTEAVQKKPRPGINRGRGRQQKENFKPKG